MAKTTRKRKTVRKKTIGGRVFDVVMGGKTVMKDFDILAEAKQPRKAVVKEFPVVATNRGFAIELTATAGKTLLCGVKIVGK